MPRAPLTRAALNPVPVVGARWTPRKKRQLVVAVRAGTIGRDEALRRFDISEEEFAAWERTLRV